MEPVDVVVLTKNSEHNLKECLESIYENVRVNRILVIDGYSTDGTLQILREQHAKHGNIHVHFDDGTRAVARQKGIELVETEWFMFVDSDVILSKKWLENAWRLVNEDVGAIWGVDIPINVRNPTLQRLFTEISMRSFKVRGGTHDTLIRYEAVKDIKIPENLHVYEDSYIKEWVANKGFRVIPTYNPYCLHHRPREDWSLKRGVSLASLEVKHGFLHHHTFFYLYATVYWLLQNLLTRFSVEGLIKD